MISDLYESFLQLFVFLFRSLKLVLIVDRNLVLLLHNLIDYLLLVKPKSIDRLISLQLQFSVLLADCLQSLEIFTCKVVSLILPRVSDLVKFYLFFRMKLPELFTTARSILLGELSL